MNVSPLDPPSTLSRRMRSSANGAVYQIRVWRPPAAAGTALLPVLYVLDGQDFFGTVVEAVARASRRPDATGVHPAIVVGIGRTAEGNEDEGAASPRRSRSNPERSGTSQPAAQGAMDGRHRDYTAGPPAEEPAGERAVGGADSFLSFIETELAPSIERELPADPARRILFGHSLAGYFALHVLATRPHAFDTYIAVSPSIWWDEPRLRAGFARLDSASPRVFIAVGEWEGELPPWQRGGAAAERIAVRRARRGMIDRARRLAAELGPVLGDENVAFHLFPDEDHASVVLVALARALRFALRADRHDPTSTGER